MLGIERALTFLSAQVDDLVARRGASIIRSSRVSRSASTSRSSW
tara:strand:- start:56 stop:187 length:132 start_codon:yes stop_codon:yes gene_type:complete